MDHYLQIYTVGTIVILLIALWARKEPAHDDQDNS